MKSITVLYDTDCGLCTACRSWVGRQQAYIPIVFMPQARLAARARFPALQLPDSPEELVVIDDAGNVYRSDKAWLVVLFALKRYRRLEVRLSRPMLRPLARRAYHLLSRHRHAISSRLHLVSDAQLHQRLKHTPEPPRCAQALPGKDA